MKHRVKELLLLTGTTLAMVAGGTPPEAWAQDPATTPEAELLSEVRWQFTNFGQVERVVEVLAVDDVSGTEGLAGLRCSPMASRWPDGWPRRSRNSPPGRHESSAWQPCCRGCRSRW